MERDETLEQFRENGTIESMLLFNNPTRGIVDTSDTSLRSAKEVKL